MKKLFLIGLIFNAGLLFTSQEEYRSMIRQKFDAGLAATFISIRIDASTPEAILSGVKHGMIQLGQDNSVETEEVVKTETDANYSLKLTARWISSKNSSADHVQPTFNLTPEQTERILQQIIRDNHRSPNVISREIVSGNRRVIIQSKQPVDEITTQTILTALGCNTNRAGGGASATRNP